MFQEKFKRFWEIPNYINPNYIKFPYYIRDYGNGFSDIMMIVVVVVILNCVSSTQFHESRLHKMIFGPNRLENTFADTSCNVSNWRSSPSLVPASCLYYVDDPEAEYSAMVRPKRNVTESLGKGQIFVLSSFMQFD